MSSLTPLERVKRVLNGEEIDRVPVCFWHHFRSVTSGEELAGKTFEFFVEKFNLDIIKIMPDLPYPQAKTSISSIDELRKLPVLNLNNPIFQEQLKCIKILRSKVNNDYPILLTLFSPLSYALRFIGKKNAIKMARRNPDSFLEGIEIITENICTLVTAAIETGADGIFISCMGATSADFTPEEYEKFGIPSDLKILESVKKGWLNTVHIHADPDQKNDKIYFNLFADYPVSAISWSDRLTGPSLKEASTLSNNCLMGGLSERGSITQGDEKAIHHEIEDAIEQTNGSPFILAPGCSIPDNTPESWLQNARENIDKTKYN